MGSPAFPTPNQIAAGLDVALQLLEKCDEEYAPTAAAEVQALAAAYWVARDVEDRKQACEPEPEPESSRVLLTDEIVERATLAAWTAHGSPVLRIARREARAALLSTGLFKEASNGE